MNSSNVCFLLFIMYYTAIFLFTVLLNSQGFLNVFFFFPRAYKLVLQTLFSIGMQQMRFQPSRSVSTKQTCFNFWPHFFSSVFQKVLSLEVKHKTSPKLFPKYLRFLDVIFCTFSIAGVSIQCWLLLY